MARAGAVCRRLGGARSCWGIEPGVTAAFRIAIVGSGPAGLSAAARAAQLGLSHVLLEKTDHLSDTIYKYQKGKHVMATPSQLVLRSDMDFEAGKREAVLGTWDRLAAEHKMRLQEIEPYLTGAFDHWHNRFDNSRAWFALLEAGRLCLVSLEDGAWRRISNQRMWHNAEDELLAALEREALLFSTDREGGEELEYLVAEAGRARPLDGPDMGFTLFTAGIGLHAGAVLYGNIAPDGSAAFVALEAGSSLLKLNPSTGAQTGSANIGLNVRRYNSRPDSTSVTPLPGTSG